MLTSEFVKEVSFCAAEEYAGYRDILALGYATSSYISVYSARKGERLFILKTLAGPQRNDAVYIEILRKEYEIGVRMDHPGICRMIAFEPVGELGYAIVMEYVNGMSLRDYLQRGYLEEAIFRQIVKELLEAVEYIHKCGYFHKDLKPENILITAIGHHVKIIDFGFAHGESYRTRIVNGGTRGYRLPGADAGRKNELSGDIYSLGKVLFDLIAALRKKPARRYVTLAAAATHYTGGKFLSVGDMLAFLAHREQRRWGWVLALGLICVLFTWLFIGMNPLGNASKHTGTELVEEEEMLRDIQSIHYDCYQLIDSTITAEKARLTAIYKQSERKVEIHRDSVRILTDLSKRIDAEYGPNRNSLQRQQSLQWVQDEVTTLCSELRAL